MNMATIVDDSVVSYNDVVIFDTFTSYLQERIPIAVCELSYICGLRVIRDLSTGTLSVDQQEYIETKAEKFSWAEGGCLYSTPMSACFQFDDALAQAAEDDVAHMRAIVNSMLWTTLTRVDATT